MHQPIPTAGAN